MATFVLTYNPDKWQWPAAERSAVVRRTLQGRTVADDWSTGVRTSGIRPGDSAVLFRQGRGNRGLIGRGTFTSEIYQAPHWDGSGRQANYADVSWEVMLEDADMLPIAEVAAVVTTVNWDVIPASGIVVPAPGDSELAALWHKQVHGRRAAGPHAKGRSAQRWQSDPVRRKIVEDYAQSLLEAKYRNAGWKVTDTRRGNPYDAIATKGKRIRYLEAKGTETAGSKVLVTEGEVRWAKDHAGECVIGIVSGIAFDAAGDLDTNACSFVEYDWDPATGVLKPQTYEWRPPKT